LLSQDSTRIDAADVRPSDVPTDLPTSDVDAQVDVIATDDRGDTVDVPDAMVPGCPGVLARREACIESVFGDSYSASTPELVAPDALVIQSESPLVAYVGDSATGRIFEVREAPGGLRTSLVAGVAVSGSLGAAGVATTRPLGAISGLSLQAGGGATLLGADPRNHVAFRVDVRQDMPAMSMIERIPLTMTRPTSGPFDIEQAYGSFAFTANNAMYLAGAASPTLLAGVPCTQPSGCEGFNAAPALPPASVFATPTALEVNRSTSPATTFVADSNNCRIRRFTSATSNVDVVAGNGCSSVGTVHDGSGPPVTAATVRLGPIGSMGLARNRFLYFADANARCSVFLVDLGIPTPTVRLVAGHGALCGQNARTGGDYRLGRLGGVAVGPVTQAAYFIDSQNRLLYRADVSPTGVPGSVVAVGVLGPRRGSELLANFRTGGIRGLAVVGPMGASATLPELVFSAPFESRVFGLRDRATRVLAGAGSDPPTAAIAAVQMEPAVVDAVVALPTPVSRTDALFAVRDRHVVLRASTADSISLAAGQYNVRGNTGAAGMIDTMRLDDPSALALANANTAYVASRRSNGRYLVYLLNFSARTYSTLVGPAPTDTSEGDAPMGGAAVSASRLRLVEVSSIAYNTARDEIYVADPNQHVVFRVARGAMALEATVLAGNYTSNGTAVEDDMRVDGQPATNVPLVQPMSLTLDATGNTLYVADAGTHRVYSVDLSAMTPTIRRVAGSGPAQPSVPETLGDNGAARSARLSEPSALAYVPGTASVGPSLIIGENGSGRLRVVRFPR
jgi:hypothetical protein